MPMPSKYRAEFPEQARKVCLLGATNDDMAEFFGVSATTIDTWLRDKPEFAEAVREGKRGADERVANALFHRALGYSHAEEKIFCHEGTIVRAETTKQYAPDTVACIFWLKNRRPDQWRDRHEHDLNATVQHEITDEPLDDAEWDKQYGATADNGQAH
jgi:hypothetical protein